MSEEALADAIASNPFPDAEATPRTLHVFFLDARPVNADVESLAELRAPSERFHLADRALYLHAPDGIGRSRLAANVEKRVGVPATARNWRTVQKLWEMAQAP